MDNINKTFNLKNGKKYIIELNDISEYLKEIKKDDILVCTCVCTFIFAVICIIISFSESSYLSLHQIFFGILGMTMFFIFFFILDKSSNCIDESGRETDLNIDCINRLKTECNDIDFSEPINIDEEYNIIYINKNKELKTLYIYYNDIRYVMHNENIIKLEGKYIDKKYLITISIPIELSKKYKLLI